MHLRGYEGRKERRECRGNAEQVQRMLPDTKLGNGVFKVGPSDLVAGLQVTNSVECHGPA